MKINYAIHASDDNSMYLDFWPLVSKLWKLKFNIEPILLHFGKSEVDNTHGTVIKMNILEDYPVALQAQCSRYYYATTLAEDVGIISDIDMLPLSVYYFKEQIRNVGSEQYVHLNPCFDTYPQVAACYHVAKGNTYSSVLGNYNTFEEYLNWATSIAGSGWCCDEVSSTHKIRNHHNQEIFTYISREGGQNGHRIDRPDWKYEVGLIKQDWYYDAHCPRPYSEHKQSIDEIIAAAIDGVSPVN